MKIQNSQNSVSMETPHKIDFTLVSYDQEEEVHFPILSVYYGITEDKTCYIYSLMKPKEPKKDLSPAEVKFRKKINRLLYKLNDGVMASESSEYISYKNGESSYYPENISDVTSSFVLGLTSFMALLAKEGITEIKAVPYLPLRYLSRSIATQNISDIEKQKTLEERNKDIQYNATNKFIRTFFRVMYHLSDLQLLSLPYDVDENLSLKLGDNHDNLNNVILNDVFKGITSKEKNRIV